MIFGHVGCVEEKTVQLTLLGSVRVEHDLERIKKTNLKKKKVSIDNKSNHVKVMHYLTIVLLVSNLAQLGVASLPGSPIYNALTAPYVSILPKV